MAKKLLHIFLEEWAHPEKCDKSKVTKYMILAVHRETKTKTKGKIMSRPPVDIELGEIPPNSGEEPSETTRMNQDDLERYGNCISSVLLSTGFSVDWANLNFSADQQKSKKNPEVTQVQEVSFFAKYIPIGIRQRLPWITFFAVGLWSLTSDTILSFYDVVSDYLLGKEHFE